MQKSAKIDFLVSNVFKYHILQLTRYIEMITRACNKIFQNLYKMMVLKGSIVCIKMGPHYLYANANSICIIIIIDVYEENLINWSSIICSVI